MSVCLLSRVEEEGLGVDHKEGVQVLTQVVKEGGRLLMVHRLVKVYLCGMPLPI